MKKDEKMKSIQFGKATTEIAYDNCLQVFEECKHQENRELFRLVQEKAEQEDRIKEIGERCFRRAVSSSIADSDK